MAQLLLLGPDSHRNGGNRGRFTGSSTTETRTPNLHRANIAHQRVRMEGWRQRRPGSEEDHSTTKGNYKTDLTLTGLLMEGPISSVSHFLLIHLAYHRRSGIDSTPEDSWISCQQSSV